MDYETTYSLAYDYSTAAKRHRGEDDPYLNFCNQVEPRLRTISIDRHRVFLPTEVRLLSQLVQDSEVLRGYFGKELASQADSDEAVSIASDVANNIARIFINPRRQIMNDEFDNPLQYPIIFEPALIALMITNPRRVFHEWEKITAIPPQKTGLLSSEHLEDLSSVMGPEIAEQSADYQPSPEDEQKAAMAELIKPHLLQFEDVAHAAQTQNALRELMQRGIIAKWVVKDKLPYPTLPHIADRIINSELDAWGFERVRGYKWTEAVGVPTRALYLR